MAVKRKNLGLRATDATSQQLRKAAAKRNTSVQKLFDEFVDNLLRDSHSDAGPPDTESLDVASPGPGIFLRMLPGAAVIKDASTLTVVWVNEGYAAMSGELPGALIGKRVSQIWAARDSADLIEKNDREALDRGCATVEIEDVRDRWGVPQRRLRIRFPILSPSGKIVYLAAIGFDHHHIVSKISSADEPAVVAR